MRPWWRKHWEIVVLTVMGLGALIVCGIMVWDMITAMNGIP